MPAIEEVATPRMRGAPSTAREPGIERAPSARSRLCSRSPRWTGSTRPDNAEFKDVKPLALEFAVRQVVEGKPVHASTRAPVDVLKMIKLVLENLAGSRVERRAWPPAPAGGGIVNSATAGGTDWALQAKAITDRVQNALGECLQRYIGAMQATAHAMGGRPRPTGTPSTFSRRRLSAAPPPPLSQMLRRSTPCSATWPTWAPGRSSPPWRRPASWRLSRT